MIWSIKNQEPLHYFYNSLATRSRTVEPEPKFQAQAPPSKNFWLRFQLQSSEIVWSPAPHLWCQRNPAVPYLVPHTSLPPLGTHSCSIFADDISNILTTWLRSHVAKSPEVGICLNNRHAFSTPSVPSGSSRNKVEMLCAIVFFASYSLLKDRKVVQLNPVSFSRRKLQASK